MAYDSEDIELSYNEREKMRDEITKSLGGNYGYYSNAWWNSLSDKQILAMHRRAINTKPVKVKSVNERASQLKYQIPKDNELALRIMISDNPNQEDTVLLHGDREEILTKEELMEIYSGLLNEDRQNKI